eukprot:5032081-Pleurochrysis_carterae.AAC.2
MLLAGGDRKRLDPPSIDDEIMIAWLGTAGKNGVLAKKNVQSSWYFACKNERGRKLENGSISSLRMKGAAVMHQRRRGTQSIVAASLYTTWNSPKSVVN